MNRLNRKANMEITIEEVRKHFEADTYLMMTGVVIEEFGEETSKCSLKINPDIHFNAGGTVQGGVIFTFADCAFAVASNAGHMGRDENLITVAQSASISYLKPTTDGTLYAYGKKVGGGKKMSTYKMEVVDEEGNLVAIMMGNGYTTQRR